MKLSFILTFFAVLTASASVEVMPQKVTLDFRDAELRDVFRSLTEQTGHGIIYSFDKLRPDQTRISVRMDNVQLSEAMDFLLKDLPYTYTIKDQNVLIIPAPEKTVQQPDMITVAGRVVDEDGHPLAGVTVTIVGSQYSMGTDANGSFSFRIPGRENIVLNFRFIGKKDVRITYTGQPNLTVRMETSVNVMDQVVITGIFDRPRESYTGSVTTISAKELETFRGQNLIQTLRNIDPAINLLENNLDGSNPNVLPDITIRGSSSLPLDVKALNEGQKYKLNTPLIIMDGFEISLTKLLDYNDDEIQSINILKDASATAIYGSRGANGVIVITSKQPTVGQLRINAKVSFDFEIPDLSSYDLMNAREKLQLEWDNGFYDSTNPGTDLMSKQIYYQRYRDMIEGTDTYWLSKPLRTGITQKYNVRLEGGSQEFRWGVTTAYNRVGGVMKSSHRDNFSGQVALQYQYKDIVIKNLIEIGYNKGVNSNYGSFSDYARMNPYHKLYDENGELLKNFIALNGSATIGNPLHNASLNSIDESGYTQVINNLYVEWNILEGLVLRGKLGISTQDNSSDRFIPPGNSVYTSTDIMERGSYTYISGKNNNYDASITLGYSKIINDKHVLYAGIDYSMLQRKSYDYTFEAIGFTSDKLNSIGNALNYASGKPFENESLTRSVGFTGIINYIYDNRYFADVSMRMDGNSQFGSNKRFAPFWSIGLGWNLHNELFLENNSFIDNLRLKLTYGETGSQQFSAYQAMRMFNYYTDDRYGAWSGAYLQGLGNDDLKWQVTSQFNIGTEMGFLNNRVTASFDYYVKKTSNLLSNLDITLATGFDSYMANIGEVKNTGFEASLGGYLIRDTERDIAWMVNGKIAYNKNEITKLSDDVKRQTAEYLEADVDTSTLFYEGYAQNSLFVVRSLGIDPSTGQEIFLDKNGNVVHEWKASDKVYAGVQEPAYRGNLSTLFRYKNLSLNLSFAYHWGGVAYNSTLINKVEMMRSSIMGQNVDRRVLTDRWQKPGDIAMFKKIPNTVENDIQTRGTTRFVMNDRVFQLQTASIEYRLDHEWLKNAGIQNARIGINMSDLFYIASVKRERGLDYPFARRVGASLSLMF